MLTKFYLYLYNLLQSEEGQDLSEYAILIGLIAVIVVAVILTVGGQINNIFAELSAQLGKVLRAGP